MTGSALTIARKTAVAGGGALLAWFVGAQGLAAVAARGTAPALLGRFDPETYPAAGSRLAQILLEQGQARRAIGVARPAVLASPMQVRAVRALGLALEAEKQANAPLVMRAAEKLSRRDTQTSLWALRDAALDQDIPRVLDQIDALARRQVQSEVTSRIFYAGLVDPVSRRAFAGRLASNPPWRSDFFANIRVNLPPASFGQMEELLDQLDQTKAPSSPAERLAFIDRMADGGEGGAARAYWVRSFDIPAAARAQTPYDPRFRAVAQRQPATSVSPFEWAVNQDASQFVAFRPADAGSVLDVTPGAADGTTLVSQGLTLAPGSHRIDTVTEGTSDRAPASWQLTCLPSGTPLIRTFARASDELSGITVDVPADGCRMQRLTLTANGRIGARTATLRQVTVR